MKDLFPNRQRTHPRHDLRARATLEQLPKALKTRKKAGCPSFADIKAFKSAAKEAYLLSCLCFSTIITMLQIINCPLSSSIDEPAILLLPR